MPCYDGPVTHVCDDGRVERLEKELEYQKRKTELISYISHIYDILLEENIDVSGHKCTDKAIKALIYNDDLSIDELTNALCNMIRSLPEAQVQKLSKSLSPIKIKITKWFVNHCFEDDERITSSKIEEQARKFASKVVGNYLKKFDRSLLNRNRSIETVERIISEALETLIIPQENEELTIADKILNPGVDILDLSKAKRATVDDDDNRTLF